GQTPAIDLSVETSIRVGDFPVPKGAKFPTLPSAAEISRATVAPGMEVRHESTRTRPLTDSIMTKVRNKEKAIYVIGRTRFTDAFDQKWIYKMRFMYTWRGLEKGSSELDVCEEGNKIERDT